MLTEVTAMTVGLQLEVPRVFGRSRPMSSGWKLKALVVALVVMALWSASPLRLGFVTGSSMAPTYHSGQPFLMSRALDGPPAVGDVVIFQHEGQAYIKRVSATEGQELWGVKWSESDGTPDVLLVKTDVPRMERAIKRHPQLGRVIHFTVPKGTVFVVGDGITSRDSRHFGPVPIRRD